MLSFIQGAIPDIGGVPSVALLLITVGAHVSLSLSMSNLCIMDPGVCVCVVIYGFQYGFGSNVLQHTGDCDLWTTSLAYQLSFVIAPIDWFIFT